jgi:hypothetical protein
VAGDVLGGLADVDHLRARRRPLMVQLDPGTVRPVTNRLKRAQGQLNAVIRMLDEGQDCEAVVTQLAAVAARSTEPASSSSPPASSSA